MRSQHEICDAIARMSDVERGQLIDRIRKFDWTDERKMAITRFIMLLGIIDARSRPVQ